MPGGQPTVEEVAHHEAGHAIGWIEPWLPGLVEWISVSEEGGAVSGHTEKVRAVSLLKTRPVVRLLATKLIRQCMAGEAAEAKFRGTTRLPLAGSSCPHEDACCSSGSCGCEWDCDYCQAKHWAFYFGLSVDIPRWQARARAFVAAQWCGISAVADALTSAQALKNGPEVVRRIESRQLYSLLPHWRRRARLWSLARSWLR